MVEIAIIDDGVLVNEPQYCFVPRQQYVTAQKRSMR